VAAGGGGHRGGGRWAGQRAAGGEPAGLRSWGTGTGGRAGRPPLAERAPGGGTGEQGPGAGAPLGTGRAPDLHSDRPLVDLRPSGSDETDE